MYACIIWIQTFIGGTHFTLNGPNLVLVIALGAPLTVGLTGGVLVHAWGAVEADVLSPLPLERSGMTHLTLVLSVLILIGPRGTRQAF